MWTTARRRRAAVGWHAIMTQPAADTTESPVDHGGGILASAYRTTTIGSFALIFLSAFENLAVTTIMPVVARELDGEALYSVAFSATLAASVIGMVAGGAWSDRRGPVPPLLGATAVFLVGLALSGFAATMPVFIAGRFLQGLGGGAITVALYVVVARVYPSRLHPSIFGAFAAAWVVPSLIGPALAGVVADTISWHWVFLGVAVLTLGAAAFMLPTLRVLRAHGRPAPPAAGRAGIAIALAFVAAAGVVAISVAGEVGGALGWALAAVALVVVLAAVRPLLPRGTLSARRGLPSTILLRAAIAAAFFATEIYLPYLLQERFGLASSAAGLILTVGAVSWALASHLQGRWGDRLPHSTAARLGSAMLVGGIAVQFAVAALQLGPLVAAAGWLLAGGGMGLVYPRINTLVLSYSSPADQGFNSAAMSIADAVGGAVAIAFAGLVFAALGDESGADAFDGALLLTALIAAAAVPIAFRVRERSRGA